MCTLLDSCNNETTVLEVTQNKKKQEGIDYWYRLGHLSVVNKLKKNIKQLHSYCNMQL